MSNVPEVIVAQTGTIIVAPTAPPVVVIDVTMVQGTVVSPIPPGGSVFVQSIESPAVSIVAEDDLVTVVAQTVGQTLVVPTGPAPISIVSSPTGQTVVVDIDTPVSIIDVGPITVQGPPGNDGADGLDGGSYLHNQGTTASTWDIIHNLGWHPNVTVVDSGGSTVEGELVHLTANSLRLIFSGAFTGVAYLS